VGSFTTDPTKLVLHFSDLSTIFYVIYKKQPKHFYYLSYQLQGGPRKDLFFCNVVPGARAAVRFAGIRRARRRFWPGEDGGRVYGPQGLGLGGYLAHGGGRRAPESSGRTAGVPGAPSVVRRRGALGGLGMRAVWGRSELRWEGARGPWEARGRLGYRGGQCRRAAASAGVAGALSAEFCLECPCLAAIFSRNLNRSAQSDE
jgi:hypothetical protein